MPFDRMIRAVDEWAGHNRRPDVFAQIGQTDLRPQHMRWVNFLEPPEFRRQLQAADVVVAHAGMGSIITSLEAGKPILVMPRRGDLMETRNDHQVATARRFLALGYVSVAFDETELMEKLSTLDTVQQGPRISLCASPPLLAVLKQFVNHNVASHSRFRMPFIRRLWRKTAVTYFNWHG